jgi:uncharacterized membrane protein
MFSLIVAANWEAIIGGIMGGLFGLMLFGAAAAFMFDCGRVADENQDKKEKEEKEEKEEARIRSLLLAELEAEDKSEPRLTETSSPIP